MSILNIFHNVINLFEKYSKYREYPVNMPSIASGQKTRQRLISVAQDFLGNGETGASVQQLADAADVSVGTLYTYFEDKSDLFAHAAEEALLAVIPELQDIVSEFKDPTLGFLSSIIFHCRRPEFDPRTTRIILTVGPLGFAKFTEHRLGPIAAIQYSIDHGYIQCDDAEALYFSIVGAFQEVVAQYFLGIATPQLAERVVWGFARQIGYSSEVFQEAVICAQRRIASKAEVTTLNLHS